MLAKHPNRYCLVRLHSVVLEAGSSRLDESTARTGAASGSNVTSNCNRRIGRKVRDRNGSRNQVILTGIVPKLDQDLRVHSSALDLLGEGVIE